MPPSHFYLAKLWLVNETGLARDALHVHFGLAIMLFVAVAFRRSLGSPWPWLTVIACAAMGELLDRRDDLAENGVWNRHESIKDFLNTIFWPSLFLLLARFTKLLRR